MSFQRLENCFEGPSKVVAIAGATGNVGRHVLESLLRAGFTVIALLRREPKPALQKAFSMLSSEYHFSTVVVPFRAGEIERVFRMHNVDTVISTMFSFDDSFLAAETALLEAGLAAGVRRFSPSGYAIPIKQDGVIRAYEAKRTVAELLKTSNISWTHFSGGIFTNYFAIGAPPTEQLASLAGYLRPIQISIDTKNRIAHLAGTGDEAVVFTTIQDVADAVASACLMKKEWAPGMGHIVGDRKTFSEVVQLLEVVIGQTFERHYHSKRELLSQTRPEGVAFKDLPPAYTTFLAEIRLEIARGNGDFEDRISQSPWAEGIGCKPRMSVQEFIERAWGKRV